MESAVYEGESVLVNAAPSRPRADASGGAGTSGPAVPRCSIRPRSGWAALDLRELWQFRDLLLTLAGRDVKLRYRQTALGVSWVVLQPLLAAGIFSLVFGAVAKLPSDGLPYFLFAYAGLLGWGVFNNTLGKAGACLVGNAHLVSKVYFPRLLLPLSTVCSTLIDAGVALAMMGVLLAAYHVNPGWRLLTLPLWMALILALSTGLALCVAALMVSYRDVAFVVPVLTQFLMYASPVGYSVAAVPARLKWAYTLNPLSPLLEGMRWSLVGTGTFGGGSLAYAVLASVVALVGGCLVFKRMERKFADVI